MGVFNTGFEVQYRKKSFRVLAYVIGTVIFLALTAYCIYTALNPETLIVEDVELVFATFVIFPYLMLGGLYGYVMVMFSFTISFICCLIFNMDYAFNMTALLVPALCFSMFSQYYWFKKLKKTILAILITMALVTFIEAVCFQVMAASVLTVTWLEKIWQSVLVDFCKDFATTTICALFLHFFFTKAPDLFKVPFHMGIGYTQAFLSNEQVKRDLRKTRVSMKISAIIIGVELVLGIFVGVFMIALFPDLKEIMISNMENGVSKDFAISGLQNIQYRFDSKMLAYNIKMILMMLNVGVPLAAFANYHAKSTIGMPLGMLSDFMYEYANAPDCQKLEVGKKADRLRIKTHDEIQVVQESVKATVQSVEEYIGRLHEEQELEKELEVAQKASEAKSAFLSNMSHEIRTPINAVLGMNEMILRESSEPQTLEYAQNVKSAGNSLLGIINDILDFSKIEAGKMDILPVEYHLSSMINDLMNMVSVKAEDKGLKLEVNVEKDIPNILFGDEVRIKQCATNVLTNAVKYTETGSITLDVSYRDIDEDNIGLRFRVVDTGIGIKEEDLNKLFSPFERIEEIRNRTIEGTGLGMSIVKKLLALMDAKLEVKSVYGEGSDFSFEVVQKVVSRDPVGDFKEKYREYLESLEKYREAFHAPDAEILVVDDTAINLTVVKGLLKSTQIKVDTAESGMETLEKVTKKKYDAIFIDHRMPEMDGLETLAAMKTLEGNLNEGVPCIALTANAGAGARDEYLAAGFDDYLSKPVNGQVLEKMLKTYLPAEKVEVVKTETDRMKEADGTGSVESGGTKTYGQNEAETDEDHGFLESLQGIDLDEAIKNSGSREILRDVVREFRTTIDPKADNIEKFAKEKDFRNYTVAVHALKSSARLIGAMELSKQAAYLEECGNAENLTEIEEKTPGMIALFRSYKENLAAAADEGPDDDKPEIPEEQLVGAFGDMKELLDAYDFDTADGIMKMLSDYRIPETCREKYEKVKELMSAVDRDGLLEIL